jgi:hypothetical protein
LTSSWLNYTHLLPQSNPLQRLPPPLQLAGRRAREDASRPTPAPLLPHNPSISTPPLKSFWMNLTLTETHHPLALSHPCCLPPTPPSTPPTTQPSAYTPLMAAFSPPNFSLSNATLGYTNNSAPTRPNPTTSSSHHLPPYYNDTTRALKQLTPRGANSTFATTGPSPPLL